MDLVGLPNDFLNLSYDQITTHGSSGFLRKLIITFSMSRETFPNLILGLMMYLEWIIECAFMYLGMWMWMCWWFEKCLGGIESEKTGFWAKMSF